MGIIQRIGRLFSAKANKAVDAMENPAEISEQILRELQEKQTIAINATADVKANALKNEAELAKANEDVVKWEQRVNAMLDKIEKEGSTPELEGFAKSAAEKYNEAVATVKKRQQLVEVSKQQVSTMEANVVKIREAIETAKDKSKTIAARQKVAEASETVNKAMSSTNMDGLMGTLDRMEEKVEATEFRAEAYAGVTDNSTTAQKIDAVIGNTSADDTLAAFRAKRNK
jgi:phage shock protein A